MRKNLPSYILCTLIAFLLISLYLGDFSTLRQLQWNINDALYGLRGDENRADDIIMVNIDDTSIKEFGEWPWSYDVLADLVATINTGEPKTMLIDLDLYSRLSDDTLGNTEILANQVSWVNNIVLTYDFAPAEYSQPHISRPDYLFNSSIKTDAEIGYINNEESIFIRKPFLPSSYIMQYADGLGFFHFKLDHDRKLRHTALIANYEGFCYPSASLLAAAYQLGYTADQITARVDGNIELGNMVIPIDESGSMLINFHTPDETFKRYSAAGIMKDEISLNKFKDKLVILGYTGSQSFEKFNTPIKKGMNRSELHANIIENIIYNNQLRLLQLPGIINVLILLGIGLLFAILLPRINLIYRMVALLVVIIILGNLTLILFSSENILIQPLYIALELVLLMIASLLLDQSRLAATFGLSEEKEEPAPVSKRKRTNEDSGKIRYLDDENKVRDSEVMAKTVAQELQEPVVPDHPTVPSEPDETLHESLDMQDSQQTPPITAKPEMPPVEDQQPAANPAGPRIVSTEDAFAESDSSVFGNSDEFGSHSPIPATPSGGVENLRSLGRYQIVGVLGKGAMGTVFKGLDPAINRMVALKTIRLDFVSDEEEMKELRDRLNREAQAAGKLSHPSIVTIFDAGSEGTLQYIAMEYLEGQTLERLIKKRVQFSYKIIANIISQICQALEYAHDQGIVHRDIKPANIMVLPDYSVKVMDFGIARVDTSSMTKTGVAMGTPNYIAPELLQGKKVDRRVDIFSLGVVIYELLTGQRPFKGENLTGLIYSIINNEPIPPSSINDNMPLIFDHVVAKALAKNPVDRYQKAGDLRYALSDFIGSFSSKNANI